MFIATCGPVSCWIFNQKGKSVGNILWVLLPLIGSIVFLFKILGDHSNEDSKKNIEKYNKVIELDPNNAQAYSNRGYAYTNTGEYDKAIADCTKAIELEPQLAVAYNNRGLAYYRDGSYTESVTDFNKAIEINPEYSEAYQNRGNAYDRKAEFTKAKEDKNKAKALGYK